MFTFGVDSFIWTEDFSEKDVWIIPQAKEVGFDAIDFAIAHPETFPTEKVKAELAKVELIPVTTTTLGEATNLICPDPAVRARGVATLKQLVDINMSLGSKVLGGVNYAAWGYLPRRPRTQEEWDWSVAALQEVAGYAQEQGDVVLAVEPVNRFETHFLNVAEDAVQYCRDVGTGNVKVHLDSFHMIREETSFREAVLACGRQYLGYVHVCENNRGIPGTGLVPWEEFFRALKDIGYPGPLTIESFDPSFEELNALCAIWRKLADSGQQLAVDGLRNLKAIAERVWNQT